MIIQEINSEIKQGNLFGEDYSICQSVDLLDGSFLPGVLIDDPLFKSFKSRKSQKELERQDLEDRIAYDNFCCDYCSGVAWNKDKKNRPICDDCLKKIEEDGDLIPFYGNCVKCGSLISRRIKKGEEFICSKCFRVGSLLSSNSEKVNDEGIIAYNIAIVKSGNIDEVRLYEYPILKGFKLTEEQKRKRQEKAKKTREENQLYLDEGINTKRRDDNLKRAKRKIERLINANYKKRRASFVRFSIEDDTDVTFDILKDRFALFKKRLDYLCHRNIGYVAVIERADDERFTKRLHIHAVFFDIDYIPKWKWEELWGYGFVRVDGLKLSKRKNPGSYVAKYMGKGFTSFVNTGKLYLCSKGLKLPEEDYFFEDLDFMELQIKYLFDEKHTDNILKEFGFHNEWWGYIHFQKRYVMRN